MCFISMIKLIFLKYPLSYWIDFSVFKRIDNFIKNYMIHSGILVLTCM